MNETFTFDGIVSSDYGLFVSGENTYNAPERDVEMVVVPGRNGTLAMDGKRYQNIEVTVPAFARKMEKYEELRALMLASIGYKRLETDYHPGEFRLAVFKMGIEAAPWLYNTVAQFDLIFDCKPQRFLKSGEDEVSVGATIENPTNYTAQPLLKFSGVGSLTIGEYTLETRENEDYILDCETMEAWSEAGGVKTSQNRNIVFGDDKYMAIAPGENTVTIDGLTNVKMIPRWWTL